MSSSDFIVLSIDQWKVVKALISELNPGLSSEDLSKLICELSGRENLAIDEVRGLLALITL